MRACVLRECAPCVRAVGVHVVLSARADVRAPGCVCQAHAMRVHIRMKRAGARARVNHVRENRAGALARAAVRCAHGRVQGGPQGAYLPEAARRISTFEVLAGGRCNLNAQTADDDRACK